MEGSTKVSCFVFILVIFLMFFEAAGKQCDPDDGGTRSGNVQTVCIIFEKGNDNLYSH